MPVPTLSEFIKHSDKLIVDRYLSVVAFRGPSKFFLTAGGYVDISSFVLPLARDIGYSIYGSILPSTLPQAIHPLFDPTFHGLIISSLLRLACPSAAIEYFQLFCLPHASICYDPSINALLLKALQESGQELRALKSFQYLQANEPKMLIALENDINSRFGNSEYLPLSPLLPSISVIIPLLIGSNKMKMITFLFQKYILTYKPLGAQEDCPFSIPYSDHTYHQSHGKKQPNFLIWWREIQINNMPSGIYPYELSIIHSLLHERFGKLAKESNELQKSTFTSSDLRFLGSLFIWICKWAFSGQIELILAENDLGINLLKSLESLDGNFSTFQQNISFKMDPCSSTSKEDKNFCIQFLKSTHTKTPNRNSPFIYYKWSDYKFNPFNIQIQQLKAESN